jgi:hypothetical protein
MGIPLSELKSFYLLYSEYSVYAELYEFQTKCQERK